MIFFVVQRLGTGLDSLAILGLYIVVVIIINTSNSRRRPPIPPVLLLFSDENIPFENEIISFFAASGDESVRHIALDY